MTKKSTPVSVKKESTNFKLDPKLKYSAELAARAQRRNLTNYVEWAIENSFYNVSLDNGVSFDNVVNDLWDVNESDRFLKLAFNYPELMTYDEQLIFKIIIENFNYLKKETGELSDINIAQRLKMIRDYADLEDVSKEYHKPYLYFFSTNTIKKRWEDIKALKPFHEWNTNIERNGVKPFVSFDEF